MNRQTAEVCCPSCDVWQRVDLDEDGLPDLETVPCQGSDSCTVRMCRACERRCYCCGLAACHQHMQIQDGRPWCDLCLTEQRIESEREAMLTEAGCTDREARAYMNFERCA